MSIGGRELKTGNVTVLRFILYVELYLVTADTLTQSVVFCVGQRSVL